MNITKLVLMRHGESQWNKENRFTGWVDVDLSKKGREEAKYAGQLLKNNGFIFDHGFASILKRAIHTLWIILDQINQSWLPISKSWQLNERHYGALQGLNKDEAIRKYGYETVQKWRRSFNVIPPMKIEENNQYQDINDFYYKNISKNYIPKSESLKSTANRVLPYWNNHILPQIQNKKNVIVVAHGNSIRAMIKFLNQLDESEIFKVNVPTGIPLIYEFHQNNKNPIQHYYLS